MLHHLIIALAATVSSAASQPAERPAERPDPASQFAEHFAKKAEKKDEQQPEPLPIVTITEDDTVITESCRVRIPGGTVIPDQNNDGVIHITADGVTVEFEPNPDGSPTVLAGAVIDNNWDTLTGVGVRVHNAEGVTLRNLTVRGYKVAVLATHADRLTLDTADLSDNARQRLRSTPLREDSADWLFPHRNDQRQWVTSHGAALAVERSNDVTIKKLRVRRAQNGIILDRVNHSLLVDNDCSFLSGWGLALWRSSGNTIVQNAFDFCVRGYSHGVYNRGQDSAGILFFEQCNKNKVLHTSATHGGDGFFGFAGREALGETPPPETLPNGKPWSYQRVGCNDNFFLSNDFSDAAAHGWEMTFSEGNRVWGNTFYRNAICGVWGGYSGHTTIEHNRFFDNGAMPYGDEHGAINIEHGSNITIRANHFKNNSTGVHLWWDDDGRVLELPGVAEAGHGVTDIAVFRNTFTFDGTHTFDRSRTFRGVWFRDAGTPPHDAGRFKNNNVLSNTWHIDYPVYIRTAYSPNAEPENTLFRAPTTGRPRLDTPGDTIPVEAREHLDGRHNIVMGEWGPWDHESPMIRLRERTGGRAVYDVFGTADNLPAVNAVASPGVSARVETIDDQPAHARVTVETAPPGVSSYRVTISDPQTGWAAPVAGTLINTTWNTRVWTWTADPLENPDAWRAEADGDRVVHLELDALDFHFQSRGPADLGMLSQQQAANAGIGRDRIATIATTTIPLTEGRWRIKTISDDGIRVTADGDTIIERWTIHGPTPDEAVITIDRPRDVELRVEHFENDGWAALSVTIEPAD